MNPWFAASLVLLICFVGCGVVALRRRDLGDMFPAMLMGGAITTIVLLLMAVGLNRASFGDLALALAVLSVPATLMYAHVLEHWL
jgi:multisubunit Na+/H+ antiporter MnhF subunit